MAQADVQTLPFDRPWLVYDPACHPCVVLLQLYDEWNLLGAVYVASYPNVFRALPPAVREQASHHNLLFDPRTAEWWQDDALFDQLLLLCRRPGWQRAWLHWQRWAIAPEPPAPSPLGPAALVPYLWVGLTVWAIVSMLWGATVADALHQDPLTGSRAAVAITGSGWILMAVFVLILHQWVYGQSQASGVRLLRQVITLMLLSLIPLLAATLLTLTLSETAPASRIWGLNAGFLLVALGMAVGMFAQWNRLLEHPPAYLMAALAGFLLGALGVGWLIL